MKYIGAIDQGTTSTRFIVFDQNGQIVSSSQMEHRQYFPSPGWVEHDADEIWANTQTVMIQALEKKGINAKSLAGIGITNQRETCIPFNPRTGEVYHKAIVWQDLRTSAIIARLKKEMDESELRERTGLRFSPYFSAGKIIWMLENVDRAFNRTDLRIHEDK